MRGISDLLSTNRPSSEHSPRNAGSGNNVYCQEERLPEKQPLLLYYFQIAPDRRPVQTDRKNWKEGSLT